MGISRRGPDLPEFLELKLREFAGEDGMARARAWMRPADQLMRVETLRRFKASRLSFADMLLRKVVRERWQIRLLSQECQDDGAAKFVYRIDAGRHSFTYIARAYAWDGVEKVGRRSDGANRDMFGALFVGVASDERIAREFATFDKKSEGQMRTDADVIGWTPANRSSRHFDSVVDALARGEQPEGDALGYIMRNGGFQSSGRNGTVSYPGIPDDHPLHHPFFADLFAIYLVRLVSVDLVNAVARTRNPSAAQLDGALARQLGIGNSSGQGMCVALQRWPHWVATWVSVRETALGYGKSRPIEPRGVAILQDSIDRTIRIYRRTDPQVMDGVASNEAIIGDLERISSLVSQDAGFSVWGELADHVAATMDGESAEQLNSLLLDLVPEFCDAIEPCFRLGAERQRRFEPAMTVAELRDILRRNYGWALTADRSLAETHQHFWYHSIDSGEQRRGERIIDPHERFESFIDHVGLIQRLASVLVSHADDDRAGDVVLEHPDIHYAMSRAQYLDRLPYAEIRDPIAHRDFIPADLIRFFLASLGIRGATPLSIRYVRGTFFQDHPVPSEFSSPERSIQPSGQRAMSEAL
ncbi:hypothetical protein [Aquibium oceanicum]|uniref:Uncharacterized protein n=1 Tax=Aquibium oceanicum TaxID=1670800 RepID=A0A1L3SQH1_9HYPH|nr:hypothetical protein [Aquibium oceanicum]APH71663.1 hypothetical protein BSQ44_10005 [Aquibium oceanicum]